MPDGRLCILDYGMMTTISEDQRIAFIEYIAHLSARVGLALFTSFCCQNAFCSENTFCSQNT
jgi:hypothetical protein